MIEWDCHTNEWDQTHAKWNNYDGFKGIPTMDQNQPKIQVELLFAYPNVVENLVLAHQRSTLR